MPKERISKKNTVRVAPELPGGFRDLSVPDAIAKNKIVETVKTTFERFGFEPMDTPAVERTEILTGGEKEAGKIIFNVKGSRESVRGRSAASGKKSDTSLRFDLTVPLARFMAANPEIPKPFRRYQLGKVWRGESPQTGRYREFTQADIDIVGTNSLDADAEVIAVIYWTLKNLNVENFVIKINNRKIFEALPLFAGFPEKNLDQVLRVIDKKNKIGEVGVKKELAAKFKPKKTGKIWEFFDELSSGAGGEGEEELKKIKAALPTLGVDMKTIETDYSVVRGLGYYTGPVFEATLSDAPELGSVFSGGRYDNLVARFTGQQIPAVGASLGVDRLIAALEKLNALKKSATTTQVLILDLDPQLKNECLALATKLRENNINTALYLGDDKSFQAQLSFAVKKEIPYVLMYGDKERAKNIVSIKDLVTREQVEIPKSEIEKIVEFVEK